MLEVSGPKDRDIALADSGSRFQQRQSFSRALLTKNSRIIAPHPPTSWSPLHNSRELLPLNVVEITVMR